MALVLHGGKARSMRPASRRQLSAVRMIPFARALHRAGASAGLAVWRLQYRDRGWNDKGSQVQDALWALGEIEREHPGAPVYLVGHSLGGRTAIAAGGHPSVRRHPGARAVASGDGAGGSPQGRAGAHRPRDP